MISPQELTRQLAQKLEKVPEVVAFVLVGSQARETVYKATEHSDMEAYIVTTDEGKEKVEELLPSLVTQFGSVLFAFHHVIGFVAVYDNLFRLELPVVTQSSLPQVFSRPKAQVVNIIFDKTDNLQAILAKRPDKIDCQKVFRDIADSFWYWQITGVQYFKKGEYYNARSILGIHASSFIKLCELLNDPEILLLESNKRIEQFLTTEQQNSLIQITPAYGKEEIALALQNAMEIIPPLIKKVKEKYGYEYDERNDDEVKTRVITLLNMRT